MGIKRDSDPLLWPSFQKSTSRGFYHIMASTVTETATYTQAPKAFHAFNRVEAVASKSGLSIPLKLSGALESFKKFDLTTVIGTQFENINLTEILHSSDCDLILRDLAITSKYYLRTRYIDSHFKQPPFS